MIAYEGCRFHRSLAVFFSIGKDLTCLGERRNHEPIPCSDDFVIEMRARPLVARRFQPLPGIAHGLFNCLRTYLEFVRNASSIHALYQDIFIFELFVRIASHWRIATLYHAVHGIEPCSFLFTEEAVDFIIFPNIKSALCMIRFTLFDHTVSIFC